MHFRSATRGLANANVKYVHIVHESSSEQMPTTSYGIGAEYRQYAFVCHVQYTHLYYGRTNSSTVGTPLEGYKSKVGYIHATSKDKYVVLHVDV